MKVTSILLAALVCAAAASCLSNKEADTWDPDPKQWPDPDAENVVVGRLWVQPNPIRLRPEWAGQAWLPVEVNNIGSEEVAIDDVYIEGSADFNMQVAHDAQDFPVVIPGQDDCRGYNGWGWGFAYEPTGPGLNEAVVVLETSDPTSPTLRVPIIFDETGEHTSDHYPMGGLMEEKTLLLTKPNPIRFERVSVGSSVTQDVCLLFDIVGSVPSPEFSVMGQGFSILSSSLEHVTVQYAPQTPVSEDGALVIEFLSYWGDAMTLVVPILVQ